ncbi:energy transducer TonB [candidate division KSB1 bacterium]|nr:energy transducer TonB [candidate division KSB1 bacterium]MBL7093000.1 energy transducer TonB [candidate division KSB1 bacterium]
MARIKNPEVDLRLKYKKVIEFTLVLSLLLCIFMFQAFKKFEHEKTDSNIEVQKIQAEEIPQTQQEKLPPPPSRPAIPIESESEDIPEDATMEETDIDFDEVPPPPPPPPDDGQIQFIPYDEPPHPIGGFTAIQKKLKYPEIARKAGIEGTVIIYAKINTQGIVINTKVVKPLGNSGCNEAAIKAIKQVRWKPAMQRDKPVTVWVSVPVKFKLR